VQPKDASQLFAAGQGWELDTVFAIAAVEIKDRIVIRIAREEAVLMMQFVLIVKVGEISELLKLRSLNLYDQVGNDRSRVEQLCSIFYPYPYYS